MPVKALTANITPIQNLNGYDRPWIGGCGQNLLPYPYDALPVSTVSGVSCSDDGAGTVTFSGTFTGSSAFFRRFATKTIKLLPGTYYIGGLPSEKASINFFTVDLHDENDRSVAARYRGGNGTFQILSSDEYAYAKVGFALRPDLPDAYDGLVVTPVLALSAVAVSWTPYENICPIYGWNSVTVTRTGKNLLPLGYISDTMTRSGVTFVNHGDGSYTIDGTATADIYYAFTPNQTGQGADLLYVGSGDFYLTGVPNPANDTIRFFFFTHLNGVRVQSLVPNYDTGAVSIAANLEYDALNVGLVVRSGFSVDNLTIRPMLRRAGTDEAYTPYQAQSVTISTGEAGTVYGGTLDVTTGVLTVTHTLNTWDGTENWNYNTSSWAHPFFQSATISSPNGTESAMEHPVFACNLFSPTTRTVARTLKQSGFVCLADNARSVVVLAEQTSVAEWKALLASLYEAGTPLQVVRQLVEPVQYRLTPAEITTLLGVNHIWADAGSVSVKYRADPTLAYEVLESSLTNAILALGANL